MRYFIFQKSISLIQNLLNAEIPHPKLFSIFLLKSLVISPSNDRYIALLQTARKRRPPIALQLINEASICLPIKFHEIGKILDSLS
mmetsp:Transcript_21495/g.28222  ORF Transcript_21495/g.28222 Transcript_21495/m.28222 type:complete len:86 (-) Transcript_21495:666-923(-)